VIRPSSLPAGRRIANVSLLALVLPIIAASPAALWAQVAERERLMK
jgi:hypothetical protein